MMSTGTSIPNGQDGCLSDGLLSAELLSKELQDARHMVSDFQQFLSGIQNQMPDAVLQMLTPKVPSFLSDNERQNIERVQKEIDKIKIELQGINHERVVVDVLTRPSMNEIKHLVTNSLVKQHLAIRTADAQQSFARNHPHHQHYHNHPHQHGNDKESAGETKYDPLANLDEPIRIPDYVPPHLRGKKPMIANRSQPAASRGIATMPNYPLKPVTARAVGNVTVVPSIKVGELPSDLRNLKIQPTTNGNTTKTKKRRKSTPSSSTAMNFTPLAKNFQLRFNEAEAEMKRLREQLAKADSRFTREKNRSNKKLQAIADMIEEKQLWKDHALLSSIDQLIQEAIDGFHDVVDEVDLITMLEEVIQEIPKPQDYCFVTPTTYVPPPDFTLPVPPAPVTAPPQEYKVVNVVRRPSSPPPPPAPEPVLTTTEVQTEPEHDDISVQVSFAEPDPVPAPQPHPVVIQQVPPQILQPQFVFQKDGVESELVKLMQTMILNYQTTVQGQQAVMLEILQDRAIRTDEIREEPIDEEKVIEEIPVPVQTEDKELQTEPIIEPIPDVVQQAAAIPEPVVEEKAEVVTEKKKRSHRYKTAFGEIVLGGKGLTGPYAVDPKVGYYEQFREEGQDPPFSLPFAAPGLRRRVSGLTMKLMHEPRISPAIGAVPSSRANRDRALREATADELDLTIDGDEGPIPAAVALGAVPPTNNRISSVVAPVSQANLLEFATKLIDAMGPAKQTLSPDAMNRDEIHTAIQNGITKGIQEALGLFGHHPGHVSSHPPESTMTVAAMEEMLVARKSRHLDDDALPHPSRRGTQGPLLSKVDVKTKDSLDSDVIAAEIEKSKNIRKEIIREDAECLEGYRHNHNLEDVMSYNDSISLDSEFRALYGSDQSFDPYHYPPIHRIEESIASGSEAALSEFDDEDENVEGDGKRRGWPRSTGNLRMIDPLDDDTEDDVTISMSTSIASDDAAIPLPSSLLPPLCSSIIPQEATSKIKEKVIKMKAKQLERHGDNSKGINFYDHVLAGGDIDIDGRSNQNTERYRKRSSLYDPSSGPSYSMDDGSIMSESSASSLISASSPSSSVSSSRLTRNRRSSEDRDRRKEILSSLNKSSKTSALAKHAFSYSSSDSPVSSTSSYRSYKDNTMDAGDRPSRGRRSGKDDDVSLDDSFDYSSTGGSENSFRRIHIPLLNVHGHR